MPSFLAIANGPTPLIAELTGLPAPSPGRAETEMIRRVRHRERCATFATWVVQPPARSRAPLIPSNMNWTARVARITPASLAKTLEAVAFSTRCRTSVKTIPNPRAVRPRAEGFEQLPTELRQAVCFYSICWLSLPDFEAIPRGFIASGTARTRAIFSLSKVASLTWT
jgi:hypothetical protein